jgi:hypothetical protein
MPVAADATDIRTTFSTVARLTDRHPSSDMALSTLMEPRRAATLRVAHVDDLASSRELRVISVGEALGDYLCPNHSVRGDGQADYIAVMLMLGRHSGIAAPGRQSLSRARRRR